MRPLRSFKYYAMMRLRVWAVNDSLQWVCPVFSAGGLLFVTGQSVADMYYKCPGPQAPKYHPQTWGGMLYLSTAQVGL